MKNKSILLLLFAILLLTFCSSAASNVEDYVDMTKSTDLSQLQGEWYKVRSCYSFSSGDTVECDYVIGANVTDSMFIVDGQNVTVVDYRNNNFTLSKYGNLYGYEEYKGSPNILYISNHGLLINFSDTSYNIYAKKDALYGFSNIKTDATDADFMGEYDSLYRKVNGLPKKIDYMNDLKTGYAFTRNTAYVMVPYKESQFEPFSTISSYFVSYDIRNGSMYAKCQDGNTYVIDALTDGSKIIHMNGTKYGDFGDYILVSKEKSSYDKPFTFIQDPVLSTDKITGHTDCTAATETISSDSDNLQLLSGKWVVLGKYNYVSFAEIFGNGNLNDQINNRIEIKDEIVVLEIKNDEIWLTLARQNGNKVEGNEIIVRNVDTIFSNKECDNTDPILTYCIFTFSDIENKAFNIIEAINKYNNLKTLFVYSEQDLQWVYMFADISNLTEEDIKTLAEDNIDQYFQQETYQTPINENKPSSSQNSLSTDHSSLFSGKNFVDSKHVGTWEYVGSLPVSAYDGTWKNMQPKSAAEYDKSVEVYANGIYLSAGATIEKWTVHQETAGAIVYDAIAQDTNSSKQNRVNLIFGKSRNTDGKEMLMVISEADPSTYLLYTK